MIAGLIVWLQGQDLNLQHSGYEPLLLLFFNNLTHKRLIPLSNSNETLTKYTTSNCVMCRSKCARWMTWCWRGAFRLSSNSTPRALASIYAHVLQLQTQTDVQNIYWRSATRNKATYLTFAHRHTVGLERQASSVHLQPGQEHQTEHSARCFALLLNDH